MKFKFCLTKKRKIVTIYVFEEDGMEKRYESDMTRKEKRQNELKKLKSMTFKQKAAYIWEYYKGVFAGIHHCLCDHFHWCADVSEFTVEIFALYCSGGFQL